MYIIKLTLHDNTETYIHKDSNLRNHSFVMSNNIHEAYVFGNAMLATDYARVLVCRKVRTQKHLSLLGVTKLIGFFVFSKACNVFIPDSRNKTYKEHSTDNYLKFKTKEDVNEFINGIDDSMSNRYKIVENPIIIL